jgi:hypothetical protein
MLRKPPDRDVKLAEIRYFCGESVTTSLKSETYFTKRSAEGDYLDSLANS